MLEAQSLQLKKSFEKDIIEKEVLSLNIHLSFNALLRLAPNELLKL
jgi:hypothetical protein